MSDEHPQMLNYSCKTTNKFRYFYRQDQICYFATSEGEELFHKDRGTF